MARLREFLDEKLHQKPVEDDDDADMVESHDIDASDLVGMNTDTAPARAVHVKPERLKHVIVRVRHDQRSARLILDRLPSIDGVAWLRYEDGGDEVEAALSKVRLVALVEG